MTPVSSVGSASDLPGMSMLRGILSAALAIVVLATLAPTDDARAAASSGDLATLPSERDVDYQLGGVREVPGRVGIVVRDRRAAPAEGAFNVCYVNAFQTQPQARRWWRRHHWGLILKRDGRPVVDEVWGEWLFDLRQQRKRARLAAIVAGWTQGCATDGFDAVEFDNLDSFTRSRGLLRRRHARAFARLIVADAHDAGLPAGQKNLAGFDGTKVGYDFAVSEECGQWRECRAYSKVYGDQVIAIEYRKRGFRRVCRTHGERWPVALRDRALAPDGRRRFC